MKPILKPSLLAASILLALTTLHIHAQIIGGPLTNSANGHIYYLLSQTNWTDSERQAVLLGGHLATIRSADEQNWIYSTFNGYGGVPRALWIGLYDPDQINNSPDRATRRHEFQWVSHEPATYSNWSPYEPDNPGSGEGSNPPVWEYYVHIWDHFDPYANTWNNSGEADSIFSYPLNGVVEIVPGNLAIVKAPNNKVQLTWPLVAATYTLQGSSTLTPATWKNISASPVTNGFLLSVAHSDTNKMFFYRLH